LGGIFFSKSKLARYVFFVDLTSLDEESKREVFNILLDNLTDKDAQQELKISLPQNH
jgi:c-di-AMP phosphodiesterase-like protein